MSDVLNNIVNLFPLSVYISDVARHPSLKDGLVPRMKALPPDQPESRYAWTGDVNGHGFIQLDEDFKPWLDVMVPHIQRYLESLQLRTEYPGHLFPKLMARGGKVRYQLKTPYNNGTTRVVFEPLDFLARLAALVPRLRVNLTRYHGVFAPNSAHRALVTRAGQGNGCTGRLPVMFNCK